jgi:hypothetical protein
MLRQFYTIFCTLNRQAELERLSAWAARKRLPGPRRLYENRLEDERLRLTRYTLRWPRMVAWAYRAQRLSTLLHPTPRYCRRGSAAAYRHNQSN